MVDYAWGRKVNSRAPRFHYRFASDFMIDSDRYRCPVRYSP